ncbi:hypothetical protein HYX18_01970 [Candidatus Woesearchaeota archaeon]|nr:hypothetical protein [Candidatus Woesearchaeota archaeon]
MEKLQVCRLCGKSIAYYVCRLCGKNVCANCYDNGICIDCKLGKKLKSK